MERLIDLFPLQKGSHPARADGMCAMELVAWLAGELHSDEPACACPVLSAFTRAFNDALPSDTARNLHLRPLAPRLVNSRCARLEVPRGLLAIDALVHQLVPLALERRNLLLEAALLRELPPVRDLVSLRLALRALATYAPEQHAARWVVQRACEGVHPARFVAGVVQVARGLGDARAFAATAELLASMADLAPVLASDPTA